MTDNGALTDIIGGTVLQALNDAGYEIVKKGEPRQTSTCRMLSLDGRICILERFHKNEHRSASGYTWKGGQPRQADPSGAASSSTTSEQPADPAAPPAYCTAVSGEIPCALLAGHVSDHTTSDGYQWAQTYCDATSGRLACCCAVGHDGPHESFGGVQW